MDGENLPSEGRRLAKEGWENRVARSSVWERSRQQPAASIQSDRQLQNKTPRVETRGVLYVV